MNSTRKVGLIKPGFDPFFAELQRQLADDGLVLPIMAKENVVTPAHRLDS
jgi:hypothetical protein